MVNPKILFSAAQVSINRSQSFRHFPTDTRATGSPTTATSDWALVRAVFNNFEEERNLQKIRIGGGC